MSEGRRTLKVNLGRRCTMCDDDPVLRHGPTQLNRIPIYSPTTPGMRLMICPVHDRPRGGR